MSHGPLSVGEFRAATTDALTILARARVDRLTGLHARSWSEAHRIAARDEGCKAIERAKTFLEDWADGLSYLPAYVELREVLPEIQS